jgi:hypothetical protein
MTINKFYLLSKFLHLSSPFVINSADKVYKVRTLIQMMINRYQKFYTCDKEISIDERMIKSKNRCNFRQYMPDKKYKYGIKVFELAESKTGYISNLEIYTGKFKNSTQKDNNLT